MSQTSGSISDDWGASPLAIRFPLFPIIEDDHSCSDGCDCKDDNVDYCYLPPDEDDLTVGITSFREDESESSSIPPELNYPKNTLILPDISRWEGKSNYDFNDQQVVKSIRLVDVANFLGEEHCHDADDEDEDEVITLSETVTHMLKSQVSAISSEDPEKNDSFRSQPQNGMFMEAMELLSQASYNDLAFEWSMLCQDCTECWTHTDLQLAAELGKTLLERNKNLETSMKNQQAAIEDQAQEIEYLSKQNTDLRDINECRLKIYEQLEVSISELEVANKKLHEESMADKATIKMLCGTIERLETKCDDLQRSLDEAESESQRQVQLKRRRRRSSRSRDGRRENEMEDKRLLTERDPDEDNDTDSNDFSSESSSVKSSRHFSNSLPPQPATSSSPISSSGYSSSSVDYHQQHFSGDSDSESHSMISKKTVQVETSKISDPDPTYMTTATSFSDLSMECLESKERILELEKEISMLLSAISSLRSENESITKSSFESISRSVEDEVQDIVCVKTGRLCRKCLGLMDATPAILIGSAFQNMQETFQSELHEVISRCRSSGGWSSSHPWLDKTLLGLGTLVLAVTIATSILAQLSDLCT